MPSEAQFTPGPWKAVRRQGVDIFSADDAVDGKLIAGMSPFRMDDETNANAALIAAAPDLYEALQDIAGADITEQQFVGQGPALALSHLRLCVRRAKAALSIVSPQNTSVGADRA